MCCVTLPGEAGVLVTFLATGIKHPDKSNLKEEGLTLAHGSRVQSIAAGRSQQERVCTEQAENNECDVQLTFSFTHRIQA